ncbi:hypothetical protein R3P38DRAFT_2793733 [Favolaschia claudopus]|uniref:Uncharacterized protein n=1 Tax=Favolaschia claudopus TaxID=2862362 RepID=A0AAW0ABU1_9AGAR
MPVPITTETVLLTTAQMLQAFFGTNLKGILIATGMDRPVTVRIPTLTGTPHGVWFQPWFGSLREGEAMDLDVAIVRPPTSTSTTADMGVAVVHVNQRNDAGHPVNLCLKRRLSDIGTDWFGNIILLEIDLQTHALKSVDENKASLIPLS